MTTQTVTAMFDSYSDASTAVGRLEKAGVPHADISIVSNDAAERDRHGSTTRDIDHPDARTGTGTGATLGTVVGGGAGLLAGLGLLAIPGLGPVVAAGWLASTLVGAGVGAAAGGAVGALTGAGIDESHAHGYAEGISRGGTLVTVRTDESRLASVTDILDDDGTVDMDEREASWRQEGWNGTYTPGTATGAAAATTTGGLGLDTGVGTRGPASIGTEGRGRRVGTYPGV